MKYKFVDGRHHLVLDDVEKAGVMEILSDAKVDLKHCAEVNESCGHPEGAQRQRALAKLADSAFKTLKKGLRK